MKTRILIVSLALTLVSCEKRDSELDSKIDKLEKQAEEAIERQRQLEKELAEQKMIAERDAIERERTLIEQERIAMEEQRSAENNQNVAALAELERRQTELMERDRKMAETQRELDSRQQELTGLENKLSERELELAGREPIATLPPIQKTYVNRPTGDYNNFYEPLSAYGSWFQTSDYGYVYQPTIVRDSSWRPYTRGRWAFTDYGWTWVSSEPFGWACYHYGRWTLLRNVGWVWIPGTIWAPAWVSWRESPGYIGWAPLPPETLGWSSNSWDSTVDVRFGIDSGWFSFISYNHFGNDIYSHCLPLARNTVIYHSTTTVTHYVIRDRYIYCGGPRYRTVCDRIGRRFPIHRIQLDHCPDFGRGGRRLNSRFNGNELQVVAPQMDAEWNHALRPNRVNRDLSEVTVDRSSELSEDVHRQYRESRQEEDQKATRWVNDKGGREVFENDRKNRLEKNREEVVKNESRNKSDREAGLDKYKNENPNIGTHELTDDRKNTSGDKDLKHKEKNKPKTSGPEVPAVTDAGTPKTPRPEVPAVTDTGTPKIPGTEVPAITDVATPKTQVDDNENNQDRKDRLRPSDFPPRIIPATPGIENHLGEKNKSDLPSGLLNPGIVDQLNIPRSSNKNDIDKKSEADNLAAKELRERQEALREERKESEDLKQRQAQQAELLRQQELEASKAKQKQEELERVQRQSQEKQDKLNQYLKQSEQASKQKDQAEQLREQEEQQKLARKEQQDKLREQQEVQQELARKQQDQLRAQQEQQEKLRDQQAQQELARKQQDQLRAQQELQEKLRDQQVQQELARKQQDQLRAQQEQQEKLRSQQEQQEKQRAQQDQLRQQQAQQELARKQQEQMERQRAQQEQQERMRQQQEQRQQQEEALRRVQEQQERARQQQEQMERQRAQQEQQERARQQQEESQRRMEEQQKQKRSF